MIGLTRSRAALFVIDVQERLVPAMPADVAARVIKNTNLLIEACATLGLPIVVSQQYPKGLGVTVQAIEDLLAKVPPAQLHRLDKLEFSAAACAPFAALARVLGRDQWIVCGMETHVCVYQTARDLVARGWQVHVAADAVCSRTQANWETGMSLVARAGAIATSTEVCVFDLLGRAGTDEFKTLSRALR